MPLTFVTVTPGLWLLRNTDDFPKHREKYLCFLRKTIGATRLHACQPDQLLERRQRDLATQLGFAAFGFVDAVEGREGIEPDGQAMHVLRRKLYVVVALFE